MNLAPNIPHLTVLGHTYICTFKVSRPLRLKIIEWRTGAAERELSSLSMYSASNLLCGTTADFHRKICAAIPRVNLAHAGKIEARNGRLD